MKKIISILACVCLLLTAIVIPASAADSNEIVLTVDSLGLASQKYSASTATVDGVGFEWVQLGNYGDGIQVRDKNGNTSSFWNTTAFSAPIKEIKLVYSSTKDVTHANPNAEIFSFGNAVDSYTYSTKLSTTAGVKEYTITPDVETYTYMHFEHDLGYSMYWDSITIVLAGDNGGEVTPPAGDEGGEVTPPAGDEGGEDTAFDPTGKTAAEIVDAAYELAAGEAFAKSVTLTGVITSVDDAYSTQYKNVTVTIVVDGADANKPIKCFRIKGDGADVIAVGDTITVTGIIKNYQHSSGDTEVEFDAGSTLDSYTKADGGEVTPPAGDEGGEVTPPTGDEGGEVTPPAGDEGGEVTPPAGDSVDNVVLTVDTLGLESDAYTAGTATVSGTSFEWVQLGNYGNGIQVRDKDGNTSSFWNTTAFNAPIKEIKLVFNSAKSTYDNPDAEIFSFGNEAGTYTCETKLSTTAGVSEYIITPDAETYTFLKFEHDLGYSMYWDSITIVLVGGQDVEITPPTTDDKEEKPETTITEAVANPVAGTAYKYALIQENLGKVLYVTGEMDAEKTFYMGTTENADEAADVYLEETTGGYYIYALVDGVKKYMNIIESEGNDSKIHINAVYGETGVSVFTQNTEKNVFTTKLGEDEYAFGTYNTFNTVSPSNFNKYPDNFWCKFYAGKVETSDTPSTEDKKDETPTGSENKDDQKLTFGVVEQPEVGTAYKFGMYQGNLKKTLYITGEMDGFYMATTDDASKAADVYLEQTTGGYYIYALVKGTKKYLGIVEEEGSDGKAHINAVFTDKPASVFTYNAALKTYVTKIGDREFTFGTRNDREYKTVSPSETKYTENFICKFYGMTKGGNSPETGDAVGSVIAMTMAIAAVMVYTSKKR